MTSPGQYASQDGSFARSAGGAAGRGLVLIIVAVIIGLVLLAKGFDGGDPSLAETGSSDSSGEPAADDGGDDTTAGDDTTTEEPSDTTAGDETTTEQPGDTSPETNTTRAPSEVKVAVVNGVGEPGLAGAKTEILDTQGYVTAAKNSAGGVDLSVVYYIDGYAEDAKAVASLLSLPADLIVLAEPADVLAQVDNNDNVADFHVFVIQGADREAG